MTVHSVKSFGSEFQLLRTLNGTAAARELNYHDNYLAAFHNRYRSRKAEEARESLNSDEPMKSELCFQRSSFSLKNCGKSHVSHFAKRLTIELDPSFQNSTGIEIRFL